MKKATLDCFRDALLARFGYHDGAIQIYLGCEIERDMLAGTTILSQKHYAEDILRTYGFWVSLPLTTLLPPHTRLSKDDSERLRTQQIRSTPCQDSYDRH